MSCRFVDGGSSVSTVSLGARACEVSAGLNDTGVGQMADGRRSATWQPAAKKISLGTFTDQSVFDPKILANVFTSAVSTLYSGCQRGAALLEARCVVAAGGTARVCANEQSKMIYARLRGGKSRSKLSKSLSSKFVSVS